MGALSPIEVLDEVRSTNALMMERGRAGAPHGSAIRARVQTAGRGRRAHAWSSPAGGLYLSVLIRPYVPSAQLPGLPVACALGIVDALREAGCSQARLKWPNDVVVGRAKLAGILTELGCADAGPFAVCGAGVNVQPTADDGAIAARADALPPASVASSLDEGRVLPSLDDLAGAVRAHIMRAVKRWERSLAEMGEQAAPLAPIVDAYNGRLAFRGERVAVLAVDGPRVAQGILLGVDEQGRARVGDDAGGVLYLHASQASVRPL